MYGEAYYFGKEFLRMAGIVRMLHTIKPPYEPCVLNTRMPTQREYEHANPEHKQDPSAFRLRWLRTMDRFNIPYRSLAYSLIVHIFAIVGLVYLLS